jgi:hypothetical protein
MNASLVLVLLITCNMCASYQWNRKIEEEKETRREMADTVKPDLVRHGA